MTASQFVASNHFEQRLIAACFPNLQKVSLTKSKTPFSLSQLHTLLNKSTIPSHRDSNLRSSTVVHATIAIKRKAKNCFIFIFDEVKFLNSFVFEPIADELEILIT